MAQGAPMKVAAFLLAALVATAPQIVSVAYAGSLVAVMEGPVSAALGAEGVHFVGEAKGSKALANLIEAGLRSPDVFVTADTSLADRLLRDHLAARYCVFGSARMVIAYSVRSPHRALFEAAAAGKRPIARVLAQSGVSIGSTDPQLDPKGARTLRVLQLLHAPQLRAKLQTFPEEDLAARVESGQVDAGFFYSTELPRPDLRVVELPSGANLSSDVAYALVMMKNPPHPQGARTFEAFLLRGAGRAILERAGLRYFNESCGVARLR
jgi:molybdate/tungstate transport system substrate-binding protein